MEARRFSTGSEVKQFSTSAGQPGSTVARSWRRHQEAVGGGSPTSGTKNGTATVIVPNLNVRNDPSTSGPILAHYSQGQSFNYDSWVIANGYSWLSYMSTSGVRRYRAEVTADGREVHVSGGVVH